MEALPALDDCLVGRLESYLAEMLRAAHKAISDKMGQEKIVVPVSTDTALIDAACRFNRRIFNSVGCVVQKKSTGHFVRLASKSPHMPGIMWLIEKPEDYYNLLVYDSATKELKFVNPAEYTTT